MNPHELVSSFLSFRKKEVGSSFLETVKIP
uniref:Uncharacterized protein n=1 Tax=Arundo donax TaxID=35708 RepID=A0A0A8ZQ02_ARUDO